MLGAGTASDRPSENKTRKKKQAKRGWRKKKEEERTGEKTNGDWLVRQTPSSCEPRVAASLDPRLAQNRNAAAAAAP
jgi:hypothetical protein